VRRPSRPILVVLTSLFIAAPACTSSSEEPPAVSPRMDFTRPELFAAPFPSDDLLAAGDRLERFSFPNPDGNALVKRLVDAVVRDARGFATTGGVFVAFDAPIDPTSLPDVATSLTPAASVALVSVDGNVEHGKRWPISVELDAEGGPFGIPNLLAAVPFAGVPLAARSTYALVVRRSVRDGRGRSIARAPAVDALLRGERPEKMGDRAFAAYRHALDELSRAGIDDVAALAVFTTGDPTADMITATRHAIDEAPAKLDAPPKLAEIFPTYCVYTAPVSMSDYQSGTPPYAQSGGEWVASEGGRAIVQRSASSRLVLTVPRTAMAAGGYPLTFVIRTGAGGDRPLVDRGVQPASGAPALVAGSGPAQELARVGFAGASADGPHGGARNATGGDEQFLMFNIDNLPAIRDNVRESALEIAVLSRLLLSLSFDASDCPGAGPSPVRFDPQKLVLFGHSMGATIAPLVLAVEPRFGAAILSGAGASWIENVLFKRKPLIVRPIIETLLGYTVRDRRLRRGDPVLTLVQWALEPADPLVYAPLVRARAQRPHVLMEQGVVDHYIMPPIANALSLALGLDLGGDPLDAASPELGADPAQTPLASVLSLSGRRPIPLPVQGNADGITAVVRQHPEDGIEDGHEIVFQTERPKAEYRCFLSAFAKGGQAPVVPRDECPADSW
jgi:hypothetical protein